MAIEKIKILGAVLELPAKQNCQFIPFGPNLEVKTSTLYHIVHEYFRACLVMFTAPNWHTLGIMVITQFNHIIAFF